MNLKDLLKQPLILFNTKEERWKYIISICLFYMSFLVIYQPFGLAENFQNPNNPFYLKVFFVAISGFNVFVIFTGSLFFLRVVFFKNANTVASHIKIFLVEILLVVLMTIFMFLFIDFFDGYDENDPDDSFFKEFIFLYVAHFFVLLYPILGLIIYTFLKQLSLNNKSLEKEITVVNTRNKILSKNDEYVKILDENCNCKLTIPLSNLYALESQNQYVIVKYKRNESLIEQPIRTRLSKVLDEFKGFPQILKCHRSYAVNLQNIEFLQTLNDKPTLLLSDLNSTKIPVSKTYIKMVKEKLTQF